MQTDRPDSGNIPANGQKAHEPETEHRTEEKNAGILHGALEKIMRSVKGYLRHGGNATGPNDHDNNEPEGPYETTGGMEEDEEYTKAKYYMLTKEERCHLKAQREMEQLGRKSPVFLQCLASCVQTPIREGIAIGCPNVPVYRLVKTYTEDAQYLFPVYEP